MKAKSETKSAPQSEARQRLAAMAIERAAVVARVDALRIASEKLEARTKEVEPIEAELAALDANESAAMSAWAKAGVDGPGPKSDAPKRARLSKALSEATAAAKAARVANDAVAAEHAEESRRIANLAVQMSIEVSSVIYEEVQPLIAEYELESRRLLAKRVRLDQVYGMLRATLDVVRGTEPGRVVSLNFEDLHAKLKRAFTEPSQDQEAASQSLSAWRELETALWVDANARLEAKAGDSAKPEPVADIATIAKKRLQVLARLAS